jgi:transcriptional regulator with XRE-family HTH domain
MLDLTPPGGSPVAPLRTRYSEAMPTGAQIRAARALLAWSANELARRAGVSPRTLRNAEGAEGIPPVQVRTLDRIRRALEAGGVEFTQNAGGGVGVRLRRR